ncbi:MAG: NACHT domain-containing protein [Acidobacteriia bacterium]|nr:NACHT domain-containing protein [Terriglobia bacterium]
MVDFLRISRLIASLKKLHVDPATAIIVLVLFPVVRVLLKAARVHVKRWGAYLVEGLLYWLSRLVMHSLAARLTLTRYCAMQLEKENKYVYIPSRFDVKVEIDRVYVTLTLNYQGRRQATFNHRTLFNAGNRIRIVGDPGSGKSSFAKRIFRDACRESVDQPSKGRLPILVELKNLEIPHKVRDEQLGEWLLKDLRRTVEETSLYKVGECFDNYSTTTGLLVILDGLDEVSSARYVRMQRAVNGLSDRLGDLGTNNVLVVTMRTQFHQQVREAFRESLGQVLFIEPFSPTEIFEFLFQWPFDGNSGEMISKIYSELTDRPTLREMCTNPLVLAMYVAERQCGSRAVIPESRTEFYRRVTEELLIKRRMAQLGPEMAPGKLREQRERILGRLAYEHLLDHKQTANSLRWADALRIVKTVMQCDASKAESVFLDMAKETGLVAQERPGETFRFIHLTFCEFLAAFESVEGQEDGWERLRDAHKAFRRVG